MTLNGVQIPRAIRTASGPAALVLLSVAIQSSVRAHHSFAPFDQSRFIELPGTVLDLKVRSPHSILTIEAEDEDAADRVIHTRLADGTPIENFERDEEAASRTIQNVAPQD